jgi:hypothetical protein
MDESKRDSSKKLATLELGNMAKMNAVELEPVTPHGNHPM